MKRSTRPAVRRLVTALAAGAMIGATLVGCSSGGGTTSGSDAKTGMAAVDAALKKGGTITYWTWTPAAKAQVAAFEKKYPKVHVKLVNAGTNTTEYTKLQNAIKAGSGAPDVAQIEYGVIPQFALAKSLVDLKTFGFDSLKKDYASGPWGDVTVDGGLWGLPQDSGPMAMFYNKTVFDTYGITVPKTWDEYVAAAKKLHAANPNAYITSDTGDPGQTTSMIWQAGGTPFSVKGTDITINLQDSGTKKYTEMWNPLVEGKLVAPIPGWSDDWYKALGNGTIATLLTGAWMPGVLESSVKDASGDWRVAPMPTYDGTPVNAENGGSSEAVIKQSKNQALAAGFLRWLNDSKQSVSIFVEAGGGFPSTTEALNSSEFLDAAPEYFGGQKINQVLVEGAKNVLPGFSLLPYQLYANSIFGDTVGKSYAANSDLNAGLKSWQKQLVDYGNQQGFTVTGK
ncbi:sugar ABC transporter substrate-binding protein [Microbacterium sp. STN6]|uniref:ABC transporter substrate-binding protein n=1 Tax=Microbacterium sp. STN6 TaxID=2995588 RepID=UPI002260CDB1|nr:sugar ABC transporter substrate-binding protein [Microbacterium sp. STN6]MCX7522251.1 sugar ABC transporter substrate-binding protein [Microbacterium sp. STN6]